MRRAAVLVVLLAAGQAEAAHRKILVFGEPEMQAVLGAAALAAGYEVAPGSKATEDPAVLAALHAAQADAGIVPVCDSLAGGRVRGTNLRTATATCGIQAIEPIHGEKVVLAKAMRGGTGDTPELARKAAVSAVARYAAAFVAPELGRLLPGAVQPAKVQSADGVTLVVAGARTFKDLTTVQTVVWLANGKKGVELSRLTPGEARFLVRGKTAAAIATALGGTALGDLRARVTSTSDSELHVTLVAP